MTVNVLLLQGSMACPSHTAALTSAVAEQLGRLGVRCTTWDLREQPLPPVDPAFRRNPEDRPDRRVQELASLAAEASAVVLASPVYHNSFSGAIKNVLDNLDLRHFQNKPVGLCGNGGKKESPQACDHLRIVVRALSGIAIPSQVVTADSQFAEAKGTYSIDQSELLKQIANFAAELVRFANLH